MTKLTADQLERLRVEAFGYWPDGGDAHGPVELEYAILGTEDLRTLVGDTIGADPEAPEVREVIEVLLDAGVVGVAPAYFPIWPEEEEDDRRWAEVADQLGAVSAQPPPGGARLGGHLGL